MNEMGVVDIKPQIKRLILGEGIQVKNQRTFFEPLTGEIDVTYEPSAAAGSVETPTITLRGI